RVLQLQDLPLDVHRDLARQVAVGHGRGDGSNVAHLGGQVAGHAVDAVGEILPGTRDAFDAGLTAELALGAHFPGHASYFGGEGAELIDHLVDGLGSAQELSLEGTVVVLQGHGLRQVALGDGADDPGGFAGRVDQVVDQVVDRVNRLLPE